MFLKRGGGIYWTLSNMVLSSIHTCKQVKVPDIQGMTTICTLGLQYSLNTDGCLTLRMNHRFSIRTLKLTLCLIYADFKAKLCRMITKKVYMLTVNILYTIFKGKLMCLVVLRK